MIPTEAFVSTTDPDGFLIAVTFLVVLTHKTNSVKGVLLFLSIVCERFFVVCSIISLRVKVQKKLFKMLCVVVNPITAFKTI